MMKVGITGGIGSGKSTVCRLFAQRGIAVYDSDAEAKRLMAENPELRTAISARFGAEAYADGALNRSYLAGKVFSDPAAHDERIAYTSQLMHVMALALCDQHLLFDSYGFEGGSFRGATRVAALDPKLWCELFWANKETLANLTDELTERLAEYSALLHGDDRAALLERLTVSSDRKKKFDALRGLDASQKPLFK